VSHGAVVGSLQSGLSEWDSSESESVPVVRGTSSGSVIPAAFVANTVKPPLASVKEKTEVPYVASILHKIVPEMTYNVLSGTLNPSILFMPDICSLSVCHINQLNI